MIYILEYVSCSDDEQKPSSSLLNDTPQLIPAKDDLSFKSEATLVVSWCIITVKKCIVEAHFCFFFLLCRPANHTERIVRLIFCVEILKQSNY